VAENEQGPQDCGATLCLGSLNICGPLNPGAVTLFLDFDLRRTTRTRIFSIDIE